MPYCSSAIFSTQTSLGLDPSGFYLTFISVLYYYYKPSGSPVQGGGVTWMTLEPHDVKDSGRVQPCARAAKTVSNVLFTTTNTKLSG
jgi:hypothetical protein